MNSILLTNQKLLDENRAYSQTPNSTQLEMRHFGRPSFTLETWHLRGSKYAIPISARRKHKEKLNLLLKLRKINILNTDDYIKTLTISPTHGLVDATQHAIGNRNFVN